MTMPKWLTGAVALAATTALLATPAMATVKAGERSFQQTYPVASRVCTEVVAGKRKHLQHSRAQVLADCALLESNFLAAQSTVLAARASITAAIVADRAAITTACPPPSAGLPACESTRSSEQLAIKALRLQQVQAAHSFYLAIEANRRHFWSAIRALPFERHLHGDSPIAQQNG
jgi:hypothetical protein